MGTIHLKVSSYISAFVHHTTKVDEPQDPITFSKYSEERVILESGLRIIPEGTQWRAACYSQSAWKNMLRGRRPEGGQIVIRRNPDQELTHSEVSTLINRKRATEDDASSYLCIQLPKLVVVDGKTVRPSASYTLDTSAAKEMRKRLRTRYIIAFGSFYIRNMAFAADHGIERTKVEIIERWISAIDIPVSHDTRTRDGLRKNAQRWLAEYYAIMSDRDDTFKEDIEYLSEKERREIEKEKERTVKLKDK